MGISSDFTDTIMNLPTWDDHNHLDTSEHLCAQSFWDVGHYFWFCRELEGLGYPLKPFELPEEARAEAFITCFNKARNTSWNQMVRRSMKELYGIDLVDVKSLFALDEAIKASAANPNWQDEVCERAGVVKITLMNNYKHNGLEAITHRHTYYRIFNFGNADEFQAIADSKDQQQAAEQLIETKIKVLRNFKDTGLRVFRTGFPFDTNGGQMSDAPALAKTGNSMRDIQHHVGHAIMRELNAMGAHLQIFSGTGKIPAPNLNGCYQTYPMNHQDNIVKLTAIFDQYRDCTFEIMNAAELNSLDIVQAARSLPNVVPGGLWWFAFRRSVYLANMQYRFEGLPACRSTLLASDARCIEWLYIKTRFVKRILAQFLTKQIEDGWADEEVALYTARCWLHDSSQDFYVNRGAANQADSALQASTGN